MEARTGPNRKMGRRRYTSHMHPMLQAECDSGKRGSRTNKVGLGPPLDLVVAFSSRDPLKPCGLVPILLADTVISVYRQKAASIGVRL